MNLDVSRKTIPDIIKLLKTGEWQVPKFQREYVWTIAQARELVQSIFKGYPIGMVTTWAQPQGKTHTKPEPLKIGKIEFKNFNQDPSIIKLVLDGKQRLTTLATAFSDLRAANGNSHFSGSWFLDFSKSPDGMDDFILYKKRSEIEKEGLDTPANCIASGLLPLDRYEEFNLLTQQIYNPQFYPSGKQPDQDTIAARATNLASYLATFSGFQIPFAELPSEIGLTEVCEIFEVLNTTGTKVSTFDLIHNSIWGDTEGRFDFRDDKFNTIADSNEKLSLLFDPARPEYVCQLITAMYLSQGEPKKKDGAGFIASIKGGDLIQTPSIFYEKVFDKTHQLNAYAVSFFDEVLKGDFRLKELPYPASTLIYFALRWALDFRDFEKFGEDKYSTSDLNKFYAAFFWRNALSSRYDQGFLTKLSDDLKKIHETLSRISRYSGTTMWTEKANSAIDDIFGSTHPARSEEQIKSILLEEDLRGAQRQAVCLFLHAQTKFDLVTGKKLDRFSEDRDKKVDMHHIYPKAWCKDNSSNFTGINKKVNSLSNLVPLSAQSNGDHWKSKSPKTAIESNSISWENCADYFELAMINEDLFGILSKAHPDPIEFLNRRATLIATKLVKLQYL